MERQLSGFGAVLNQLDQFSTLFKPGRDVRIAELSERLRSLEALWHSADKIRRLGSKLGLNSADQGIWDRDWRDIGSTAEWTIGFLDKYANRPPEPLVRAATNSEIRQHICDAARENVAVKSDEFTESWEFLTQLFDPDEDVSTGIKVGKTPVPTLHDWVGQRRADASLIQEWLRLCELREQLIEANLSPILSELLNGRLAVEDAKGAFLANYYRSWLDWVHERDPALRRFSTEVHERQIDQFRELDRGAVQSSFTRIREARLSDPARPSSDSLNAPSTSELGTLLREVNKKKRHLPLRQLFAHPHAYSSPEALSHDESFGCQHVPKYEGHPVRCCHL